MKTNTISIVLGIFGIFFVLWFNYNVYDFYQNEILNAQNGNLMNPIILTVGLTNKLIGFGIGFFSLVFGIISFRNNENKAKIGITLSILNIIMAFVPIWTFFI